MAGKGYAAQNTGVSATSDFARTEFHAKQLMNLMSTATIVEVKKFRRKQGSDAGGGGGQQQQDNDKGGTVEVIGFVDVLPLVNMVDGDGGATKHGVVNNIPYFRLASGKQAIIMDPQPGDIGMVIFADRDISAVKKEKKQSNPGSKRRNNYADGMYISTVLSKEKPEMYILFDNNGMITISPDKGTTLFTIKKDEVRMHAQGISVYVTPNRIDLGKKNAPHAVSTVDGPSEKVFAVINESD